MNTAVSLEERAALYAASDTVNSAPADLPLPAPQFRPFPTRGEAMNPHERIAKLIAAAVIAADLVEDALSTAVDSCEWEREPADAALAVAQMATYNLSRVAAQWAETTAERARP